MRMGIHALKKLEQMIRNIANGMIEILCGCTQKLKLKKHVRRLTLSEQGFSPFPMLWAYAHLGISLTEYYNCSKMNKVSF